MQDNQSDNMQPVNPPAADPQLEVDAKLSFPTNPAEQFDPNPAEQFNPNPAEQFNPNQPQQPMQQSAPGYQSQPVTTPEMQYAIILNGLAKVFDEKVAVNNLFLQVPKGSFFGLVGPNGAGKTTTLSMATGLLRPTAGQAIINGIDIWAYPFEAKQQLGVLADGVKLFDRLTGRELLNYTGLLRGLDKATVTSRTEELLGALELSEDANKLVVDYSAGMTKKIALACALIHAPAVLVLDEPFESVDPISSNVIRSILHNYIAGGGTVILSSHVMELVEKLCSHVAVIAAGQVLAQGTTEQVKAGKSLDERFVELVGGRGLAEGELSWLQHS